MKKFKVGTKFIYNNIEYIITDIPMAGTFCVYAINVQTGKSIVIRPEKEKGCKIPWVIYPER